MGSEGRARADRRQDARMELQPGRFSILRRDSADPRILLKRRGYCQEHAGIELAMGFLQHTGQLSDTNRVILTTGIQSQLLGPERTTGDQPRQHHL